MAWINGEAITQQYLDAVNRCLTDDKMFSIFRLNPVLRACWGSSSDVEALAHMDVVKNHPSVLQHLSSFKQLDSVGHPYLSIARHDGDKVSPDVLRWSESICLIEDAFGPLDHKTVQEFGIGHGGLAACLMKAYPSVIYSAIDFNEVIQLGVKYLGVLGLNSSLNNVIPDPYLAIAEYSLTELTNWEEYYELYFKDAENVFIRSNFFDINKHNHFIERLRYDFDLKVVPEMKSRKPNKIVYGRKI